MRRIRKSGKTDNKYKVLAAAVPGLVMAISLSAPLPALGAEPGWSQQEDGWHYYLEDGSPAVGWVEIEGKSYYLPQNGGMLKDTVTPDGYYVDQDGAWYEKKEIILETEFQAPQQVRDPSSEWNGKEALNGMRTKLSQRFSGNRSFRVGENAVEFVKIETAEGTAAGSSSFVGQITGTSGSASSSGGKSAASGKADTLKETVLLGLYREPGHTGSTSGRLSTGSARKVLRRLPAIMRYSGPWPTRYHPCRSFSSTPFTVHGRKRTCGESDGNSGPVSATVR